MEPDTLSFWQSGKNILLGDKATIEILTGNKMSAARYTINENIEVAKHFHEYEQIVYVLSGMMILNVDGKDYEMRNGDAKIILSNQEHSAKIIEVPYKCIEFYSPKRNDIKMKD